MKGLMAVPYSTNTGHMTKEFYINQITQMCGRKIKTKWLERLNVADVIKGLELLEHAKITAINNYKKVQ